MVCTLASRLLGFVRSALIGALFGGQGPADVLNFAFGIPNNLRKLLAEGAFSAAFIPALSASLASERPGEPSGERARKLVSGIMGLQYLVLLPLVVLGIVFARPFIELLAHFPDPGKTELAVRLFRWLFAYILFVSLSSVLMAVLNTHSVFILPALTPVLFSVAVIGSLLLFARQLGVFAMAVGVLAGGAAQVLVQWPVYRRLGYRMAPAEGLQAGLQKSRELRMVVRQWIPVVGVSAVFVVMQQVAMAFASGLEDGSTSALSYAIVLWQFPFGIFSASVSTVLFPRMSRQAAAGELGEVGETLTRGLRLLSALLIPSAALLVALPRELVAAALQRGSFSPASTIMTARVLRLYGWGLLSVGGYTFLQRFFYSLREVRVPIAAALVTCALDIGLSIWLKETRLRVAGLALANTISFSVGAGVLLAAAARRVGSLRMRPLAGGVGQGLAGAMVVGAAAAGYAALFPRLWLGGGTVRFLAVVTAACLLAASGVLGVYRVLGVREVMQMFSRGEKS